ncbi:MAG: NBR1-Ig-like domain-containing protein [Chloroflexota bacterium]
MRNKNIIRQAFLAVTVLLLAACGPSAESLTPTMDATLIYTQAAQTVAVQFTQTSAALTAAAPTQTNTPAPTLTEAASPTPIATLPLFTLPPGATGQPFGISTPTFSILPLQGTPTGALCDNSAYIRDVGTPDGTVLKPGQAFAKGWLIQNTGTCSWKIGYHLVQVGGNSNFGGGGFAIRYPSDVVLPGTIVEISLNLVAPKQPGTYEGRYQMYNDRDIPFGTGMTVAIEVQK